MGLNYKYPRFLIFCNHLLCYVVPGLIWFRYKNTWLALGKPQITFGLR